MTNFKAQIQRTELKKPWDIPLTIRSASSNIGLKVNIPIAKQIAGLGLEQPNSSSPIIIIS